MNRWPNILFYVSVVIVLALPVSVIAEQLKPELVKRGEYLVYIMDCRGCHTPGALIGKPDNSRYLAGSKVGTRGPWGTSYPGNLTPDDETGLGKWTAEEIMRAVRQRMRKNGKFMLPIMPTYEILTDEDAKAVAVYLKSMKPIRNRVPENLPPEIEPRTPYVTVIFPDKKQ